jgi:hypothetical protein
MNDKIEYFGDYGIVHLNNGDENLFSVCNFRLVAAQFVSVRKPDRVLFTGTYLQCRGWIQTNCGELK